MTTSKSFLDTTVFADRLFGTPAVRRIIDGILAERPACATKYVREQFRATFLRAAVLVYNQMHETGDTCETLRRTDEFAFFTRGEGVKARKVLVKILQDSDADSSDKLATLERLIEVDMLRDFDDRVTAFARRLDLHVLRDDGAEKLRDKIVEHTIGFRLRSSAVRGRDSDGDEYK
jgi:hypothetical protein